MSLSPEHFKKLSHILKCMTAQVTQIAEIVSESPAPVSTETVCTLTGQLHKHYVYDKAGGTIVDTYYTEPNSDIRIDIDPVVIDCNTTLEHDCVIVIIDGIYVKKEVVFVRSNLTGDIIRIIDREQNGTDYTDSTWGYWDCCDAFPPTDCDISSITVDNQVLTNCP